LKNFSRKWWTY